MADSYHNYIESLSPSLWHKLDESSGVLESSSETPMTLTNYGASLEAGALMNEGTSVEFFGGDYLEGAILAWIPLTTTFSIGAHINATVQTSGSRTICHLGELTVNNYQGVWLSVASSATEMLYTIGYRRAGSTETLQFDHDTIPPDTTQHVLVTADGTTFKLYIQGVLVDTLTAPGPTVTQTDHGPWRVGGLGSTSIINTFDGKITNPFFFGDKALTATEALRLYQAGVGPTMTLHPVDHDGQEGEDVTLTVAATSSGGALSYQWFQNSAVLLSGETSASLVLTTVFGNNGDEFYCEITDDNGTVASDVSAFVVAVDPTLSAGYVDLASGCLVTTGWDFANSTLSGRVSAPFQVYSTKRHQDVGYKAVTSRSKIRGRGASFYMTVETEPAKDCKIMGWNLALSGNPIV